MGQLTVDLRDADLPAGDQRLQLDVGVGEAVLIVPDDVCVATDASVGIGGVSVFDRQGGGVDVDYLDARDAEAGGTRLLVDADIGVGHLDVRSNDQPSDDEDFRFGGREPFFDGELGRGRNAGCA
jgi:predicted membrane protein